MKTIEVLRPNPYRREECKILDRRRRVGGDHICVRGVDGSDFVAVKYMGQWGQRDGWFDWAQAMSPADRATP